MLLTISTNHRPATDLGYLLHKNPGRAHVFDLPVGKAHVFYLQASEELCTAALLLEIDPITLVRTARRASLRQYVNDRPYVASSFMSTALLKVFGTAMSGSSKDRPQLAATAIPLTVTISALPCRGGEDLLRRLVEPLGYQVSASVHLLDHKFPEWGLSPYLTVRLEGTHRLADTLQHLYVLISTLDDEKHYWIGRDEVDKLMNRGGEWLASHPQRDLIIGRYLKGLRTFTSEALERRGRGIDLHELQEQVVLRREAVDRYAAAYRRYCWPVQTVDDLRLAPFHVLATEARVHTDETHEWHMEQVDLLAKTDAAVLVSTPHKTVDLSDETSEREAIEWWRQSADAGGEGIVLKPFDFIARSGRGIVQPGIKCRGHEYLRIIYGPEYDRPDNLLRLRDRGSLSLKRSLALRE